MTMIGGIKIIGCLALLMAATAQVSVGAQAGVTETVFNRRFIPTIRPGMTYEQVMNLAGGPGLKTGENKKTTPATIQYRRKGGRGSILTANFAENKITDAAVLAPNKHTYLIKRSGEVVDITK